MGKGLYDLRPGLNKGIEKRPSPGFYLRDTRGVALRDCSVRFPGKREDFGEALRAERCEGLTLDRFDGRAAGRSSPTM